MLKKNIFEGDLFQVCAGNQCELEELCREEQRKVVRKVNISACFEEEKKLIEDLVDRTDAVAGSQGGLQIIRGTQLSYHSQAAASAERTQDVQ